MLIDEGLELLTEEEAWALVQEEDLGRIGVSMSALPAIFPVNYVVLDGAVLFRTSPGSKLSAASANAIVAFQVDHHDRRDRSGWSVLIIGLAEVVHDVGVAARASAAGLEPYADGRRGNLVRVRPELVSGRRVVHEPLAATPADAGLAGGRGR